MSGTLYIVATPIGNLGDLSPRAADILANVDFIASEDTRVTVKLLNHLGLKKPQVSYYEHNRTASGSRIVERLLAGEDCALVSDAGTPAISDPGEDLVRLCAEKGLQVIPVPGACAAISALSVSALSTQRFCFEGFLSTGKKSRQAHLEALKAERRTMVLYEAPHKLLQTLRDLLETLGDRRVSLSREITKLHEETLRCTLSAALAHFEAEPPRGEFVLVVEGAPEAPSSAVSLEDALEQVNALRAAGLSLKDAVKQCAAETGLAKNELYDAALKQEH